jgi:hypothetical protein
MSFDAQSLERLRQLGRTLPQRLPPPEPSTQSQNTKGAGASHRLETETDPQALFHELMRASPDGHIPAHLLERLRELEGKREVTPASSYGQCLGSARLSERVNQRSQKQRNSSRRRRLNHVKEYQQLYAAFQQLLLDEEN